MFTFMMRLCLSHFLLSISISSDKHADNKDSSTTDTARFGCHRMNKSETKQMKTVFGGEKNE